MSVLDTEAIILRTYNLAEADKIVVALTHGTGLLRGVAKGCRRVKTRFGAALEPFTLVNLSCYQKENQELVSIRQAEIVKSSFHLANSEITLEGLAHIGDLVVEFSPPFQPNEQLFRMLKACISAIGEAPSDLQAILRYFEVWLLKLEGFLPDLKRCAECREFFDDAKTARIGADMALRCARCSRGIGRELSKGLYAQLRATQKLRPEVFAEKSRELPSTIDRELAQLTQRIIGSALDRQPRSRISLQ
jgi:DNA repair protein RecO (recombination protein O)